MRSISYALISWGPMSRNLIHLRVNILVGLPPALSVLCCDVSCIKIDQLSKNGSTWREQ